jgi:hypothetical protein
MSRPPLHALSSCTLCKKHVTVRWNDLLFSSLLVSKTTFYSQVTCAHHLWTPRTILMMCARRMWCCTFDLISRFTQLVITHAHTCTKKRYMMSHNEKAWHKSDWLQQRHVNNLRAFILEDNFNRILLQASKVPVHSFRTCLQLKHCHKIKRHVMPAGHL